MNELERRFHREMVQIYERAKRETGYHATRFLQMVSGQGGLATARTLLHAPAASDGFTALWERSRLDLSVEALVLRPEFAELFDDDERDLASDRLRQYGSPHGSHEYRSAWGAERTAGPSTERQADSLRSLVTSGSTTGRWGTA